MGATHESPTMREVDAASLRDQERRVTNLRKLAKVRPTDLVLLASLRNEEELFVLKGGSLERLDS
jgi:hypothetical protein